MFLDASAIVAILGDEEDAGYLAGKIEAAKKPIYYSPLSVFEAVISLARKKTVALKGASASSPPGLIERIQIEVEQFLEAIGAREIAIGDGLHQKALDAARTYGRFVGHPARLNFGDCFAYACAKSYRLALLYKGNDFVHTDIEAA
jgi:ribonuclease VapC